MSIIRFSKDINNVKKSLASKNRGLNIKEKILKGNDKESNEIALFPIDVVLE